MGGRSEYQELKEVKSIEELLNANESRSGGRNSYSFTFNML